MFTFLSMFIKQCIQQIGQQFHFVIAPESNIIHKHLISLWTLKYNPLDWCKRFRLILEIICHFENNSKYSCYKKWQMKIYIDEQTYFFLFLLLVCFLNFRVDYRRDLQWLCNIYLVIGRKVQLSLWCWLQS